MRSFSKSYHHLQWCGRRGQDQGGSTTFDCRVAEQSFPHSTHGTPDWEIVRGEKTSLSPQTAFGKTKCPSLDEPTNHSRYCNSLIVLENFLQDLCRTCFNNQSRPLFLWQGGSDQDSRFEDSKIRPFFGQYTDYLDEKLEQITTKCKRSKGKSGQRSRRQQTQWPNKKSRRAAQQGDIETLENVSLLLKRKWSTTALT